jgi:hypothetical protein
MKSRSHALMYHDFLGNWGKLRYQWGFLSGSVVDLKFRTEYVWPAMAHLDPSRNLSTFESHRRSDESMAFHGGF